jgi:hypothetical protein
LQNPYTPPPESALSPTVSNSGAITANLAMFNAILALVPTVPYVWLVIANYYKMFGHDISHPYIILEGVSLIAVAVQFHLIILVMMRRINGVELTFSIVQVLLILLCFVHNLFVLAVGILFWDFEGPG